MKAIYVSHPLGNGPDRETNRREAMLWVAAIAALGYAVVADWIILTGEWSETPENRAKGLAIDFELINRCDEVWLCGPNISDGMKQGAEHALRTSKLVRDLTGRTRESLAVLAAFA